MKLKLFAVITDAAKFAAGETEYSVSLFNEAQTVSSWHNLHEVELSVPDELIPDLHKQALADLDEQEKRARANFESVMDIVNRQREKLLALPHMGESDND